MRAAKSVKRDTLHYSVRVPERGRAPPPGGRLSRRLGILWLIVADHDCIYWLYLYGPDLLYPYLLLYYTLHPTTQKVAIFSQTSVNA